jgi:hypothetical protein
MCLCESVCVFTMLGVLSVCGAAFRSPLPADTNMNTDTNEMKHTKHAHVHHAGHHNGSLFCTHPSSYARLRAFSLRHTAAAAAAAVRAARRRCSASNGRRYVISDRTRNTLQEAVCLDCLEWLLRYAHAQMHVEAYTQSHIYTHRPTCKLRTHAHTLRQHVWQPAPSAPPAPVLRPHGDTSCHTLRLFCLWRRPCCE